MRILPLVCTATLLSGCDHPAPAAKPPGPDPRASSGVPTLARPAAASAPDAAPPLPSALPARATVEIVEVVGPEPAPGAALTQKGQVLFASPDLKAPQVWYDEDTMPLHAHVVVQPTPIARARYEAFVRTHPRARIATVVNGIVEDVRQATPLGEGAPFFITPRVPAGTESNAAVASSLSVAMGGKPRTD